MSNLTTVTEASFRQTVLESPVPVLVDFYATWCPPCQQLEPVVEQLAETFDGQARVVKVNIDESPGLASAYGVTAVPTLHIFEGGEVVDTVIGLSPGPVLRGKLEARIAA